MGKSVRKLLTVGLIWHSVSSDNLGVGALTESQIALCRRAAHAIDCEIKFVIFGTEGRLSYVPEGAEISIAARLSLKQLVLGRSDYPAKISECDVVLDIGEGDSFTDIYGLQRFIFLIASKLIVLGQGRRLVLSPQTIGPFDHWYSRWIARSVMKRCEKVFVRDGLSAEYMRSLGLLDNVEEVIDVAFSLPYSRGVAPELGRINIGLNVSGLLFSGGYTGKNQFGLTIDYPSLVRKLLAAWSLDARYRVWLIAHVVPDQLPRDDDRVAIEVLAKEFPEVRRAPDFTSPGQAKSFISTLDFMTGARMHACIAAFSSGVPVVPVAYSRKFNGLFSSLGYEHVVDGRSSTTEDAFGTIMDVFSRRAQVQGDIDRGNQLAQQRLNRYVQTLQDVFCRNFAS
ncbi:polysaccharide pyruvyl transferase family protein [uncultured Sphaerotilus sp.]|uniref:polysaccharide pyruvyl transferase family protein n=1 Tax=uncultured Sphaerotilus sp. TaxID=474984 RepID=UPI0030CA2D0D